MSKQPLNASTVLKSRAFAKFQRKAGISDSALCKAAQDADAGMIDADLGGGVIKLRIARAGGGKSGGFRTILAFRRANRAVYIFGFQKKDFDNVSRQQLADLQKLAASVLSYNEEEIRVAVESGTLIRVPAMEEQEDAEDIPKRPVRSDPRNGL